MQWWYGHNAVAFFLTTPFLGLMYYFLPKAAERPVYSLPAVHPALLVAGLHLHLGRPAPPALHRAARVGVDARHGVLASCSGCRRWGGMINGLLTLRGAWDKVADDPVLKFFVVGRHRSTAWRPSRARCSRSRPSTRSRTTPTGSSPTSTPARSGWNGFMAFGMIYWLLPRLFQTQLYSKKLAELHFWIGSFGILLYVVAIYSAGVTAGPDVARVRRHRTPGLSRLRSRPW